MPNYREATTEGQITTWRRSRGVNIDNTHGKIQVINFYEEQLARLHDGTVVNVPIIGPAGLTETMADPTKVFPMVNPETMEVIGSATYMDIYVMLFSLYRELARKRDEATTI